MRIESIELSANPGHVCTLCGRRTEFFSHSRHCFGIQAETDHDRAKLRELGLPPEPVLCDSCARQTFAPIWQNPDDWLEHLAAVGSEPDFWF